MKKLAGIIGKISLKYYNIISISLVCLTFIACNSKREQANEHYLASFALFQVNNYKEALNEIKKAREFDTTNFKFAIQEARIRIALNLDQDALNILKWLQTKNNSSDTLFYLIGESYFGISKSGILGINDMTSISIDYTEDAIKNFEKALFINPTYYEAYIYKYQCLHNIGKYVEALNTINIALKLFKDSAQLILGSGIEKGYLGDRLSAINDIDIAIKSNTLSKDSKCIAYRFKGNILLDMGRNEEALDSYTYAIHVDSTDAYSYASRGELYKIIGKKDSACIDLRKAAELGMPEIYKIIGSYCN